MIILVLHGDYRIANDWLRGFLSDFRKTLDFLVNEITDFSKELPLAKKSLDKLLHEDKPCYTNRKGTKISINKLDLLELAKMVPEVHHASIKLPFIFISRGDHFFFSGSNIEEFYVENIIDYSRKDKDPIIFRRFFAKSYRPKYGYYYGYMIKRIKKRFPSLVIAAYSLG